MKVMLFYDPLHAKYDTKRVNHQTEYSTDDGVSNNMAESYFARFRRMQYGQTHKFGIEYLLTMRTKRLIVKILAAGRTVKSLLIF